LSPYENELVIAVHNRHPESPQILSVLVQAYMADFRWFDALTLTDQWTEMRPDSALAWNYRGEICQRLLRKNDALESFRNAVQHNSTDQRMRFNLAKSLLQVRRTSEAAVHLEWLQTVDPANALVLIELGVCREAQGDPQEAAAIFDRVIALHPSVANAYYQRGRLDLNRGKATLAMPFLRQANVLDPSDPEILYSFVLCLREVGSPEETREVEERLKRTESDLKRVAEVARLVARSPRDPDLRREMGELFLRNGREADALRWLQSALRQRPDHGPTNRVLADYYERNGQSSQAAYHRSFFQLTEGHSK
jgi:tetratricopeptide (TPR) repeat protein